MTRNGRPRRNAQRRRSPTTRAGRSRRTPTRPGARSSAAPPPPSAPSPRSGPSDPRRYAQVPTGSLRNATCLLIVGVGNQLGGSDGQGDRPADSRRVREHHPAGQGTGEHRRDGGGPPDVGVLPPLPAEGEERAATQSGGDGARRLPLGGQPGRPGR